MFFTTRAVSYSRFSSDLQRDESIEAQERAISAFCDSVGYTLVDHYSDHGISGRSDQRPEFQRMIADAMASKFDVIVVHKLDRFSRDRYYSAFYKKKLSEHGIKLISVLENFNDDSPESIILESVLEGMAEYYSRNLAREVRKGLNENALACKSTGGPPALGYSVDPETKRYVINPREAEAVKLIFNRFLTGKSYTKIIAELNENGYKTRRNADFSKNSLFEILRNERYTGVYIYVKDATHNKSGKYSRHAVVSDEDVVRVDGGMPQIISLEDFNAAQKKLISRKHCGTAFAAKQEYLLTGKLVCGECGSTYAGNSKRPRGGKLYITYRCTRRNHHNVCHNPEIDRDTIEQQVTAMLADTVFDEKAIPLLVMKYNEYVAGQEDSTQVRLESARKELSGINNKIQKIIDLLMDTPSQSLKEKLGEYEAEKGKLEHEIANLESQVSRMTYSVEQVTALFREAKKMFLAGTLSTRKAIIDRFVDKIVIYPERIDVLIHPLGDFTVAKTINL